MWTSCQDFVSLYMAVLILTRVLLLILTFSIIKVFKVLQEIQEAVDHKVFKNEEEIYSVGWMMKYCEDETALHVFHMNGWCMNLIYCFGSQNSIRVTFSLDTEEIDNMDEFKWYRLENLIKCYAQEEKKVEEPVIVKGIKSIKLE